MKESHIGGADPIPEKGYDTDREGMMFILPKEKKFWLSIRKAKNCLYSRRNGKMGKLIWGYSICLRLFGKTIL